MKRSLLQFAGLLLGVAAVAVLSCRLSEPFFAERREAHGSSHQWVHEQLGIDARQEELLKPIEERYREQRRQGEERIHAANRDLAAAILADKGQSERTDRAVEQIHDAMGDLQKATLNHVFEMKAVLRPEQYEKLLQLTADGLCEISGD